jgi:hypothetical protein
VNPDSVVGDAQHQVAAGRMQFDDDVRTTAVSQRMGDGFLNDPLQMIGGQAVDQAIIEFGNRCGEDRHGSNPHEREASAAVQ